MVRAAVGHNHDRPRFFGDPTQVAVIYGLFTLLEGPFSPYFTATREVAGHRNYSKRDSRLERPLSVRLLATSEMRSMGTEPSDSAQVR